MISKNFLVISGKGKHPFSDSKIEQLVSDINEHKVLIEDLPLTRDDAQKGHMLGKIALHQTIGLALKSIKYDAVFVRNVVDPSLLRLIRLFNDKLILELTPFDPFDLGPGSAPGGELPYKVFKKIVKASRCAKVLFLEGDHQERSLKKFNQNIVKCPPVLPLTQNPSDEIKGNAPVKTIGIVCLEAQKGLLLSLEEQFKAISEKYPEIVISVKSDSFVKLEPPIKYVYKSISGLNIDEIYSDIDILIFPAKRSENSFYGNNILVLHALARKIPCIVWRTEIDGEIFEDGKDIFIVSRESEFLKKISSLIEDQLLRVDMGERGFHKAEKHFSPDISARFYLNAFEELIMAK